MAVITIHTRLESDTVKLPHVKEFIGKDVEITVRETHPVEKYKKREWKYLGAADSNGALDTVNIRDYAHD